MRDNLHDYRKNYNKGELTKNKVDALIPCNSLESGFMKQKIQKV